MTLPIEKSGGRGATPAGATVPFRTRPGTAQDHNFVFATWLRAYRKLGDFVKLVPNEVYFKSQHARVERLLARAHLEAATLADEPNVVLGYVLTEGDVLHWIYVKGIWRKMGIATALLAGRRLTQFSHYTAEFDRVAKHHPDWQYNPYAAE